jgi:predicted CopG family antitoxin
MKTIKIKEETWKKLMQLKIEHNKASIDETINMLFRIREER